MCVPKSELVLIIVLGYQMKTAPRHREEVTGGVVAVDTIPAVGLTDVEEASVGVVVEEEGAVPTETGAFYSFF